MSNDFIIQSPPLHILTACIAKHKAVRSQRLSLMLSPCLPPRALYGDRTLRKALRWKSVCNSEFM